MLKEPSFAINGYTLQIRREGDNVKVIFGWEGFRMFKGGYGTRLIPKFGRRRYV
jgi:hypothetical protein